MSGNSDAQLVEWSRTGDRSAFAAIVKRYQSLVCSITYNATGSLSLSEDLAQETFFAAWKQLSDLREPARLRSWLCGITRFLVGKEFRRRGREPLHAAESLDAIQEPASLEASPSMLAVSREEEAILWRALGRIPDAYREPLILFYREEKSIERVAAELELSEDAVKQRLSRGRKLLHEEVVAFVEGTLSRTAPGQNFLIAVLAMLPTVSAATVGVGMAGKGTAAAKSGLFAAWLVPLAPFVGVLAGLITNWLSIRATCTARERRFQTFAFTVLWIFVLAWSLPGQFAIQALRQHYAWSTPLFYAVMTGFWWFYAIFVAAFTVLFFRRASALRRHIEQEPGAPESTGTPLTFASRLAMVAGIYLACFSVPIWLAWRAQDRLSAAIMAGMIVVLTVWHFLQTRSRTGPAAIRAAIGHVALLWGIILLMLNLRLNQWMATFRGTNLADFHRILPEWAIPLATLTLLIWVGILVALTKPRRPASLDETGRSGR
jgi:RNA polymerase sigma factor (sigma-70 family)